MKKASTPCSLVFPRRLALCGPQVRRARSNAVAMKRRHDICYVFVGNDRGPEVCRRLRWLVVKGKACPRRVEYPRTAVHRSRVRWKMRHEERQTLQLAVWLFSLRLLRQLAGRSDCAEIPRNQALPPVFRRVEFLSPPELDQRCSCGDCSMVCPRLGERSPLRRRNPLRSALRQMMV